MFRRIHLVGRAVMAGAILASAATASWAQPAFPLPETFTGTVTVKAANGTTTSPTVTIVITRLTTNREQTAVMNAVKAGGTAAVVAALKAQADTGYIDAAGKRTPLKYAYTRDLGTARLITVVAPTAIAYLGADLPNAKPKAGFDLAVATLDVKNDGTGFGDIAPAATIKINDIGAVEVKDYGLDSVRIPHVTKKK